MTVYLNHSQYEHIYDALTEGHRKYRIIHGTYPWSDSPKLFADWAHEYHGLNIVFGANPPDTARIKYWVEFDSEEEKTLFLLSWNA